MPIPRGLARPAAALLATAAVTLSGLLTGPAVAAVVGQPVTVVVDGVSPNAPVRSTKNLPLTFTVSLTNTTSSQLSGIALTAERGYPLTSSTSVSAAIASPPTDSDSGPAITSTGHPAPVTIPPHGTVETSFVTTTSLVNGTGLCICANAVYPIILSASAAGTTLGSGTTFVPVEYQPVKPTSVAWLWPLIDRPHRLLSDTVFTDDDLAADVASGGRLDRALQVLEQLPPALPVTALLDPETIAELQTMATTSYRFQDGSSTRAGTGSTAAQSWLARLRQVLSTHTGLDVDMTPYADPDMASMARHHRHWAATLPAAMAAQVTAALGTALPSSDVAWPAATRVSSRTADYMVGAGVNTVVVGSRAISAADSSAQVLSGADSIGGVNGTLHAVLADVAVQPYVATGLDAHGTGVRALPAILSRIAAQVFAAPTQSRATVLAPPRYVDPDVAAATQVVEATSTSTFTQPTSVDDLSAGAISTATFAPVSQQPGGLPEAVIAALAFAHRSADTIRSMVDSGAKLASPDTPTRTQSAGTQFLAYLPVIEQRLQSTAWRDDAGADPSTGTAFAQQFTDFVQRVLSGVYIVRPATGSYTLGSSSSRLPITVANTLDYPVGVVVRVATVGNVTGFSAQGTGPQLIPANSRRTVELPTTIERSGRIQVRAVLSAPDSSPLGEPQELVVHSTALGEVGVFITIAAGALLIVALFARAARAVVRRRRRRPVQAGTTP